MTARGPLRRSVVSLTLLLALCAAIADAQERWDEDVLMRVSIDTVVELAEVSDDPRLMIVVAARYLYHR